jgi:hypothetical protein
MFDDIESIITHWFSLVLGKKAIPKLIIYRFPLKNILILDLNFEPDYFSLVL